MEALTYYGPSCFPPDPDREEVFSWLRCAPEAPCRAAYEQAWPAAAELLRQTAAPRAVILREPDGRVTVCASLGPEAEERASALFSEGRYIEGSLLNTLCDQLLFQMAGILSDTLQRMAAPEGLFPGGHQEPGLDLAPQEVRRRLALLSSEPIGVSLSEYGVFSPAKSMLYGVQLSRDACGSGALHDCSRCPQTDCAYRRAEAQSTEHKA